MTRRSKSKQENLASTVAQPAHEDPAAWQVIPLWPDGAVGQFGRVAAETRTVDPALGWRTTTIIKNVFEPTMTVIRPRGRASGASVIVLPGGGFGGLAWQHEGTEVGEFLAARGITAFVLKYRVQRPSWWRLLPFLIGRVKAGLEPAISAAAADGMQAVRLVRADAELSGADPRRVGMIGFSAGAMVMLRVLRAADEVARPDFAVSVYGFLWEDEIRPGMTPLLIAAAEPDPAVADAARLTDLWRRDGAPVETHTFTSGGHGFGLGRPETDSGRFSQVLDRWLLDRGYVA